MTRREELISIVPEDCKQLTEPMIDEMLFLETQLMELKKLPFIEVNPKNPKQQRNTPASKMYKEFLQQYINCIKSIEYVIYKDKRLQEDDEVESPLRKWFKSHDNNSK